MFVKFLLIVVYIKIGFLVELFKVFFNIVWEKYKRMNKSVVR